MAAMIHDAPRRSFEPLRAQPELSPTLPSWLYRESDVLEAERQRIFYRGWTFVAHTSEVATPGRRAGGWIDDRPVTVERDEAGVLRAGVAGPAGPDPLRVETLGGLVFVNMDADAAPLHEQAPGLDGSLRDFMPAIDSLVKVHETVHEVASNWKVMVENSLECYHCEPCHPGFAEAVAMDRYRSVSEGIVTIHTSERRRPLPKFGAVSHDDARANRFSYWYLWPGTEIDATSGAWPRLSVFTRRTLGPERFQLTGHYYRRPGDEPSETDRHDLAENQTLREDIAICEAVQRGLRAPSYEAGRYSVRRENGVFHFHSLYREAMER
jgi:carnitine monooxygenase subunit